VRKKILAKPSAMDPRHQVLLKHTILPLDCMCI